MSQAVRCVGLDRAMRRRLMRDGKLKCPVPHPIGFALIEEDHPTKGWGKRYASRRGKRSNRS